MVGVPVLAQAPSVMILLKIIGARLTEDMGADGSSVATGNNNMERLKNITI